MKRNNAFALILLGVGLSIGCNNPPLQNTTNTTTAHTLDANTQTPAQFCETNCEEKAFDLKVSPGKSLPLKPEEQNSLNDALKERPDTQTHIEGAAVNGAIQFHPAPGPARITADTPLIAVRSASDPKQIIRIPLTAEAAQLARPRAGASH